MGLIPGSGYLYRHCLSYGRTARNRLGRCLTNRPASLSAAAALALFGKWPVREPAPQGGSLSPSAKSAAARRAGQALLRPPKPPLAPRRGQKTCVKPEARLARPPFSLFHRARRIRLRPKSRRFAAVGLRHASADAVSFRKRGAPAAPRAVGRGGRNRAERRPRRQAGAERAEFLPTTWGVHCTSHRWSPIPPAQRASTRDPLDNKSKT